MGTFGQSLSREIGKNTGKWVSNKVFGNGHATPHKIIHERERLNARIEKEQAREYKQDQLRYERERKQLEKEIAQMDMERAEHAKLEQVEANQREVNAHNNYILVIQSVHKDYSTPVDWNAILESEEPEEVLSADMLSEELLIEIKEDILSLRKASIKQYKPSIVQFILPPEKSAKMIFVVKYLSHKYALFGLYAVSIWLMTLNIYLGWIAALLFTGVWFVLKYAKVDYEKSQQLSNVLNEYDELEQNTFDDCMAQQDVDYAQYLKNRQENVELKQIAKGILKQDFQSYRYAINLINPLKELKVYGSDFSYETDNEKLTVNFFAKGESVIPPSTKKILRNGLEIKEEPIPKTLFQDIYQDYVCSCVLRIAKDLFVLLPLNYVKINCYSPILNTAIGKFEESIILSIVINREVLENLNFDLLDPSDSMRNFNHNMNFIKGNGFVKVEEYN